MSEERNLQQKMAQFGSMAVDDATADSEQNPKEMAETNNRADNGNEGEEDNAEGRRGF